MSAVPAQARTAPASVSRPLAAAVPAVHRSLRVVIGLEGLALGGCPINALDLARTLIDRGHRVDVFAIDEQVKVSLLPHAEGLGLPVTRLPSRAGTAARARQILAFAAARSADIIHVFAPWLGPAATIAAARRPGCSAVVTNWMMENVDYTPPRTPLILGTRALQEEAQARHRTRVWLMEPPVNLRADRPDPDLGRGFRRELGIGDDEIAVVVVSRLDAHLKAEGIGYAIEAIKQLRHPGLRLILVGDGDAAGRLAESAAQANRELGRPAVVLAGARPDPRPAYASADFCLGMGGSALRALAHGKPVIVLGERGFARRFEPATTGYFYTAGFYGDRFAGDPVTHLADQLRALLDEPLRRQLAAFGLAEVRNRFGLEASAAMLEEIYRAALAATPGVLSRSVRAAELLGRAAAHETIRTIRGRGRNRLTAAQPAG